MNSIVGILRALLTLNSTQFQTNLNQAQTSMGAFAKTSKALGQQMTQLGTTLTTSLTAPILGFGGAVAKAAIDFESSFAGIRKTIKKASDEEFKVLSQQMRKLSTEIPVSVNELNKIGQLGGQLGVPIAQIKEFSKVVAGLQVATDLTDAEDAALSLARIGNLMQMDKDKYANLGGAIVQLGNTFSTTESQIVAFSVRIAGAGHLAHMQMGDILGLSAALGSVGVTPEAGGTATQKVITSMITEVIRGGPKLEAFGAVLEVTGQKFAEMFRADPGDTFVKFVEGLGRQGERAVLTLDGLELRDQRLVRSFLALAGAGSTLRDAMRDANAEFKKSAEANALARETAIRFATTESQLRILWNRLYLIAVIIGEGVTPSIKDLIKWLEKMTPAVESAAQWWAELPKPIRNTALAIGLLTAALGPVIWWVGQLTLSISGIAKALAPGGFLAKGLGWLSGGLRWVVEGMATLLRGVGLSTVGLGLFGKALAAIAVPIALYDLYRIFKAIYDLHEAKQGWAKDRASEEFTRQRMLEEASRVARRTITNEAEALGILRKEGERLRAVNAQTHGLTPEASHTGNLLPPVKFDTRPVEAAIPKVKGLSDELNHLKAAVTNAQMAPFKPLTAHVENLTDPMVPAAAKAKTLADELRRLNGEIDKAEQKRRGMQPTASHDTPTTLIPNIRPLAAHVNALLDPQGNATFKPKTLADELNELDKAVKKLKPSQLADINAGLKLGIYTNEEIATRAQTTEAIVRRVADTNKDLARETTAALKIFDEFTGKADRTRATEIAEAILGTPKQKPTLFLAQMTEEQQRRVAEALQAGVESWKAMGRAVPPEVSKVMSSLIDMRLIPDMVNESNKALANSADAFKDFGAAAVAASDAAFEHTGKLLEMFLQSSRDVSAAQSDMLQKRLQTQIEYAKASGKGWKILSELEGRLAQERYEQAKRAEVARFEDARKTYQAGSAEYIALAAVHHANMLKIQEDFVLTEQLRRDELRRTHNEWLKTWTDVRELVKKTWDQVTDGLMTALLTARSFKEEFTSIWESIRASVANILAKMLRDAIAYFAKLAALAAAQKWFGYTPGGGSGGGGGGGSIVNSVANAAINKGIGLLTGGATTATTIAGTSGTIAGAGGMLAGGTTGGAGLLATTHFAGALPASTTLSATGGAGGSAFYANPAFWTNPYTIGAMAAAAVLTWGITKKGWFRGGEEGVQVNPRRDQFLSQFGVPSNKGVGGAGWNLAARLTQMGAGPGGGNMFASLQASSNMKSFQTSEDNIIRYLNAHGVRGIRKFNFGGFVPPGAVIPAILHGGSHGEIVTPVEKLAQRAGPQNIHFTIQAWDGDDVTRVFRTEIIPRLKTSLLLNQDDLLGHTKRVLR